MTQAADPGGWLVRVIECIPRIIGTIASLFKQRTAYTTAKKQGAETICYEQAYKKLIQLADDLTFALTIHNRNRFVRVRNAFLEGIRTVLGSRGESSVRCCILVLDGQTLIISGHELYTEGYSLEKVDKLRLHMDTAAGRAYTTAGTVYIKDRHNDNLYTPHTPINSDYDYNSILCIPMNYRNRTFGVINIDAFPIGAFTESEVKLLESFASFVVLSYVIEHTLAPHIKATPVPVDRTGTDRKSIL